MKKENQIILDLLRFSIDKKANKKIRLDLKKDLDWQYIYKTSIAHGVASIIYKNLKSLRFKKGITDSFKKIYKIIYKQNSFLYKELKKISKVFEKEKIDFIALKGMYLAKNIYKDIGLRPMGDIDLLYQKKDITKIRLLLKKQGFKFLDTKLDKAGKFLKISESERYRHCKFFKKNILLELHSRPMEIGLPYKNTEKLWKYYSNKKFRHNYDIIFLSSHLLQHGFNSLKWFYDIMLLLNQKKEIDWNFIYNTLKEEGMKVPVYYSIKFTLEIFKKYEKLDKIKKIKPNIFQDKLFKKIWTREEIPFSSISDRDKMNIFYFNLTRNESWINLSLKNLILNMIMTGRNMDKIKYIINYIFPPKEYIKIKYNYKSSLMIFLIYFYRPLSMVKEYLLLNKNN